MPRRQDNNYDRQLEDLFESGIPSGLPLVHVTSAELGKDIVRITKLRTAYCKVFKTDLLYFFVLRPAYCLKGGEEPADYINYFPAVFVVRPEAVDRPHHIYPFDTGAGASGIFDSKANKLTPLDDYALKPTHEGAAGFIGWAFGTLGRYYEGRLRPGRHAGVPDNHIAISYLAIAEMGLEGSREHDKRASTVEVASWHNVELLENSQLIIFPKVYLEDSRLEPYFKKLHELGAQLEPYDWQVHRTPNEFQKDMIYICRKWYKSQGYGL